MSFKRPHPNEISSTSHAPSPAFSPAFSPPPETPGSLGFSPRTVYASLPSGRRKSKMSKRRKSSNIRGRDEAADNQREVSPGPNSAVNFEQREEELDPDPEEDDNRKQFDDDDYTTRKREDMINKNKLKILVEHFDAQQMDRFSEYRNSGFSKGNVKKLANSILQQSVSERVTIAIRGFAKVFVGHIVEQALEVQKRRGGSGPLTQHDLKEAYRAYLAERDRGGSDRRKMFAR
ncbi:hypothetical protein O181_064389 [Austropuccinia psidii MF-1]|uniref:TAFII28-like protein domain-containing protein n=1 Tax=Austropuccinia psidii MF-1 TaxID=1389203 RepID=A0A9Q3EPB7_9BASI|nr:hypothetical protein [Austropuccinia psidii MF-1]